MPARPAKPCLGFRRPCPNNALVRGRTRCDTCQKEFEKARNASRPQYGAGWDALRKQVLERDQHICWKCGGPANTVDHVRPVAKGGSNDPSNLAACCGPCNFRSGGSTRR